MRPARGRAGAGAAALCLGLLGARPAAAAEPAAPSESLAAQVRSLQPAVEELRGLRFRSAVPVTVVGDSAARAYFVTRLDATSPPARLQNLATAYGQLGLLPPGTDLRALLLDVLEEQAGGYYDPQAKTFCVLGDMPPGILSVLIAHELTHALDDQHYQLDSVLAALPPDDDDVQAAAGAVMEGSGTLVMTAFTLQALRDGGLTAEALVALQESEAGRAERLRRAPPAVQRALLGPYVLGQSFLLRGHPERVAGPLAPADLDRAFRNLPRSTEQLLHADKYWEPAQRDDPLPVAEPDLLPLLGRTWQRVESGTLGELLVALLTGAAEPAFDALEAMLPERWTTAGASGWGGDRWWLYTDGERTCTVLLTRWDDGDQAGEFHAALTLPAGCRAERRGDTVAILAGAPSGRAQALLRECFKAAAQGPR